MSTKLCLIQYAECMIYYVAERNAVWRRDDGLSRLSALLISDLQSPPNSAASISVQEFKDIQIPDYFPDLSKLSQRMKFFSIYRDDRVIKVLNILENGINCKFY